MKAGSREERRGEEGAERRGEEGGEELYDLIVAASSILQYQHLTSKLSLCIYAFF
jgi:hypothetical protein